MHNTEALGFGITILVLLVGIFLSRSDITSLRNEVRGEISSLRGEMNTRFNALDARIDRIFSELGTFHSIQGEHKAKIEALEKNR